MARRCLEHRQHAHFEQPSLLVQIHHVNLEPLAVSATDAEIKPGAVAVLAWQALAVGLCPHIEFYVEFRHDKCGLSRCDGFGQVGL